MSRIRLASRGSALALWQAEHVRQRLVAAHPGLEVVIEEVRTTGDRVTGVPLARIGGHGLFTREVDRAVMAGAADAAVHSLKDLPTTPEDGTTIAAVLAREDPADALVVAPTRARTLADLPAGAKVGTSSLRRRAQLLHRRPDVYVEDLRGNLDTRLRRVAEGHFDAVILALAGIRRLGREHDVAARLDPRDWLPAAGQGALAVSVRGDDAETERLVAALDDPATRLHTRLERTVLSALEGGCQVPIGVLATSPDATSIEVRAFVGSLDGTRFLTAQASAPREEAEALAARLVRSLRDDGAGEILDAIRGEEAPETQAP
ncbi:MAG: hydroxymethylbilane synthase [Longimicrobiales bacterium]